jgi:hypothetical protein
MRSSGGSRSAETAIPDVVYIDSMAGELFWKKKAMSAGINLYSSISAQ